MNKLEIIRFERKYNRDNFDCGKVSLNNYIQRNVTKDVKNGSCTCFVILDEEENVIGYYTLSSESIPLESAPEVFRKKIKYPYVPVILLGRLALDKRFFGKGLGKTLLVNALKKCLYIANNHIGSVAVVVDPLDDEARQFYKKYGFIHLQDSGRMIISMQRIRNAFETQKNK